MENFDIVKALEDLPAVVGDAFEAWRIAEVNAERVYAREYLENKAVAAGSKKTVAEIEAMVKAGDAYYLALMESIKAEANYMKVKERLYAAKKLAEMRTSF